MNKPSLLSLALFAALATAPAAQAADVVLINLDSPGVGLNDTTPAAPVGRNPGTTRGEQARIVYRYAMDLWGGALESNSAINIYASFAPLSCTATSGTLAQAGANWTFNLTSNGTTRRYGSALADAVIGFDLFDYFRSLGAIPAGYEDDYGDIFSQFNGALGSPGCLEGMSWYFGLDGKTPDGQVNFLNVVMHEIAHGLGVQGFLNKSTGSLPSGLSDPYTYNAYDNVLNKPFESMTNSERALAMRTPGRTVWTGANVNRNAKLLLDKRLALTGSAPAALAGKKYEIGFAAFGTLAGAGTFSGKAFALVDDGDGASTSDGCSTAGANTGPSDTIAYVNKADVAGKVAVVDRGTCSFEYKAKIAQDNGAVGVVIVNNAAGVIDMARAGAPTTGLTIPTVMISQADGAELKASIASARAAVQLSDLLTGADANHRVRLYAPTTVASGSTFSHFDTVVSPNALMEPFDTPSVQGQVNVDMTLGLFADIGWTLNPGNGKVGSKFQRCDTGVPAVSEGGFVLGANLQAAHTMCVNSTSSRLPYYNCMKSHADYMKASGLLSSTQHSKLLTCSRLVMDDVHR